MRVGRVSRVKSDMFGDVEAEVVGGIWPNTYPFYGTSQAIF